MLTLLMTIQCLWHISSNTFRICTVSERRKHKKNSSFTKYICAFTYGTVHPGRYMVYVWQSQCGILGSLNNVCMYMRNTRLIEQCMYVYLCLRCTYIHRQEHVNKHTHKHSTNLMEMFNFENPSESAFVFVRMLRSCFRAKRARKRGRRGMGEERHRERESQLDRLHICVCEDAEILFRYKVPRQRTRGEGKGERARGRERERAKLSQSRSDNLCIHLHRWGGRMHQRISLLPQNICLFTASLRQQRLLVLSQQLLLCTPLLATAHAKWRHARRRVRMHPVASVLFCRRKPAWNSWVWRGNLIH